MFDIQVSVNLFITFTLWAWNHWVFLMRYWDIFQPCLQWQNQDALLSRTTRWVKKASRSKWPLYPVFVRRRPLAALSAITAVAVSRVHLGRWMVLTKRGLLFRRVLFDSIWEHHRRCAESDAKEFIVFSRNSNTNKPEEVPGPDWT